MLQNFSALYKEELPQSLIQWLLTLLQASPPSLVIQVLSFQQMRRSKGKNTACRDVCTVCAQSHSRVQLFVTPWTEACQPSLSSTISRNVINLMSIESVMPSSHLILSSPSLLALNLSQHQGLFHVSALHIRCLSIGASAPIRIHIPMNIQD